MRKTKLFLVAVAAMFGLNSQAQEKPVPETIGFTTSENTETYYYLYNVDAKAFFTEGNAWGTQFSIGDTGLKVAFTVEGSYYLFNDYSLAKKAWKLAFFDTESAMYVDHGSQKNWRWGVEDNGETFRLYAAPATGDPETGNTDWGDESPVFKDGYYVGWDAGSGSTACHPYLEPAEGHYINWALVTEEAYNAVAPLIAAYNNYKQIKAGVLSIKSDLDVSEADAIATGATTVENYEEATAKLLSLFEDYLASVEGEVDFTGFIVNPSFETGNISGWTVSNSTDTGAKENSNATYTIDNADGDYVFNIWSSGNPISQTIENLPNGTYKLMALIATDTGHQVQLNANGENAIVDAAEEGKGHGVDGELEFTVLDGKATIGAEGVDKYWYKVDNFRLYYTGPIKDLTPYKESLEKAVTEANKITEGTIPAGAYTALTSVIAANNTEWSSIEEYNAAEKAIKDATTIAQAFVAPYETFLTLKANANDLVAAGTDNPSGRTVLADGITSFSGDVESTEDVEVVKSAAVSLKEEMATYANASNPVGEDAKFNMTFMLTNPNLEKCEGWKPAEGWYNDQSQPTQNSQVMNTNAAVANTADPSKFAMYEYWSASTEPTEGYVVYQKIVLPEGTYKMTALAFAGFGGGHRYGYQTDGDHTLGSLGEGDPNITFSAGEIDGTSINTPTLEDASIDFVQTVEGEVKIGLKAHEGNRSNWMGIGYVELFKVPAAKPVELDESKAYDYSYEGAATAKLTRDIAEGFNTVILPFSLSAEELTTVFGAGSLYTFIGADEGKLSFESATSLLANKPYLFKADAAKKISAQEIEARTFVKAEKAQVVAAGTDFSFVGTYAPLAAGNEVITNKDYMLVAGNKFQKAQGGNALKAFRAYIKQNEEVESRQFLTIVIDGETTAIDTIDGKAVNSNAAIYNLAGQKVKNAQKGIFIQNGKKMVK